jgi:hypothetical protein
MALIKKVAGEGFKITVGIYNHSDSTAQTYGIGASIKDENGVVYDFTSLTTLVKAGTSKAIYSRYIGLNESFMVDFTAHMPTDLKEGKIWARASIWKKTTDLTEADRVADTGWVEAYEYIKKKYHFDIALSAT